MSIKKQFVLHQQGFTITELLVSTLITGLVIVIAGLGLVNIMRKNQDLSVKSEGQRQLNLALDFIETDIREAISVSTIVTNDQEDKDYIGVFELTRSDGTTVSYYTSFVRSDVPWKGPIIIYRLASTETDPAALVDAISDSKPTCTSSGSDNSDSPGLNVSIQDSSSVKICLLGQLIENETLLYQRQAFTRGFETP